MPSRWITGVCFSASLALLACSAEDSTPQKPKYNGNGQGGGSQGGAGGVQGGAGGGFGVGGGGPGGAGPGGAGPGGAGPGGAGPGGGGGDAGSGSGGDAGSGSGGDAGSGAGSGGDAGSGAGSGGDAGSAGVGGGGAGGVGGGNLPDCTGIGETPTNPVTGACGSFITPFPPPNGTKLQLGPYGAKMDVNVGTGFENADPNDSGTCSGFAAIFGEDPKLTNQLLNIGPQPCSASGQAGNCLNQKLYSVYYPAIWPEGPVPVLSWGNGTCAQPEGYGALLRYVASYGFVVVAPNTRQTGTGAALRKGLDFMAAANMSGPYAGHLDMTKVGVMGHSQGAGAANGAAGDSRADAVILFNGGATGNAKPFMTVSAQQDIGNPALSSFQSVVNGASKGAYLYFYNPAGQGGLKGHLTLMLEPQRLAEQTVAFWQMTLQNNAEAKAKFVGANCKFCGHSPADYAFGQKGF